MNLISRKRGTVSASPPELDAKAPRRKKTPVSTFGETMSPARILTIMGASGAAALAALAALSLATAGPAPHERGTDKPAFDPLFTPGAVCTPARAGVQTAPGVNRGSKAGLSVPRSCGAGPAVARESAARAASAAAPLAPMMVRMRAGLIVSPNVDTGVFFRRGALASSSGGEADTVPRLREIKFIRASYRIVKLIFLLEILAHCCT